MQVSESINCKYAIPNLSRLLYDDGVAYGAARKQTRLLPVTAFEAGRS